MSWGAGLNKRMFAFFRKHKVDYFGFDGRSVELGGNSYKVYLYDEGGNILLLTGTAVPTALAGFAKGGFFLKTDAAGGTRGLYENIGTTASCDFNIIGDFIASDIHLNQGNVLVGNASNVAEALNAKASGQILVGNGTTVRSLAVSGQVSINLDAAARLVLPHNNIFVGSSLGLASEYPMIGDGSLDDVARLTLQDVFKKRVATTISTAGAGTITAAAIVGGLILRDPNGADRTDSPPVDGAMLLAAAVANPLVGSFFDFVIRNTGSFKVTFEAGASGITFSPAAGFVILPGQERRFLAVMTNVGSGTEAATIYSFDSLNLDGDVTVNPVTGVATVANAIKNAGWSFVGGVDQVISAASLVPSMICVRNPAGPSADTLDTAANIIAALGNNVQVGQKVEWWIFNQGAGTIALTAGTGVQWETSFMPLNIYGGEIVHYVGRINNIGAGTEVIYGEWVDCGLFGTAASNVLMAKGSGQYGARSVAITGDIALDTGGVATVQLLPKHIVPDVLVPISDDTAGDTTVVADMMLSGLLLRDCNGADRNDTFDSAELLVAAIAASGRTPFVGQIIEFTVYNNSVGVENWMFTLGAGMTGINAAAYATGPGQFIKFYVRLTDVGAGTETADVYWVATPIISDAQVAAGAAIGMAKLSLAITNTEVAAGAAIDGDKITPRFGDPVHELTLVTVDNLAGDSQYNVAAVLGGIYDRDTAGAARDDKLPDAATLVAGITGAYVGQTFKVLVSNISAAADNISLTAGIDGSLRQSPVVIAQNKAALIAIRLTNIGAGTEEYQAYLVSLTP